ncbi:MAG: hypothetical protein JJU00_02085 [Opitutales bacterium]|nr:hypothetical protein [Opitutales bacterium]
MTQIAQTASEVSIPHGHGAEDSRGEASLRPTVAGTGALLIGIAVSFLARGGEDPAQMAGVVAWVMLAALGISIFCDFLVSLRNLVRVDLFALLALYFLTLFEFLFDQQDFARMAYMEPTRDALAIVLTGFLGIVIGRHFIRPGSAALVFLRDLELSPRLILLVFFGAFVVSKFYMFLAVNFNPFEWFHHLLGPRFTQPWTRARLGGWKSLLNELALLGLIIPPLAGVIFAQRKRYGGFALFSVAVVLLLQLLVAIAPGTRNTFAINLAGFLGGYFLCQPVLRLRPLAVWGIVSLLFFVVVSEHMVNFRTIGLRAYIEGGHYRADERLNLDFLAAEETGFMAGKGYFVDYNLYTIHELAQVFPSQYGFLGMNVYWVAATKPVPRAIWPGKPEDLEVGIEEALGVEGMTLACTFAGEAWMAGGFAAVLLTGLAFGMFFAWWNRLGCAGNSLYAMLVYASGFLAALISMRSLMFTTTMILPAVALIVFAKFFLDDDSFRRPTEERDDGAPVN